MRETAIVVNNANENVSIYKTIDAIKQAGFKNVFIQWYNEELEVTQEKQLEYINKLGLNIIFAHLGYQNINAIWEQGNEGEKIVDRYINDIKKCRENNIQMVVMHLTSKSVAPLYNEIGLNRIRKITNFAKENNIKVAFENTKIKGYLDYVISNIKDENVGICFDSGHCYVHFNNEFNFELYKNRIFAVHLHDNDKTDDLHLMPYEGTIDWKWIIEKLKYCNYSEPITLELCYRYEYLNLDILDFYKKGLDIANELASKFDD